VQDTEVDYSNVLTIGGTDIVIGDAGSSRKALPPGTSRDVYTGYEEVRVPAIDASKVLPPAELVTVDVLDGWARAAFAGYKTLNRIQSRIFQVCSVQCE
jgi:activating signal cointegrator complex subunit 3